MLTSCMLESVAMFLSLSRSLNASWYPIVAKLLGISREPKTYLPDRTTSAEGSRTADQWDTGPDLKETVPENAGVNSRLNAISSPAVLIGS